MTWGETHRVVDDATLVCLEGGDGPPLLVLHGVDGGAGALPFHDGLATRFRVLAPSLPGFGRSALPDWLDSVDDLAYLFLDLLERLGPAPCDVLGLGFGGWVAAEMAVRSQARVRRLVLADAVGIKVSDRETVDIADTLVLPHAEAARLAWHDPAAAASMPWPGAPGVGAAEMEPVLQALQTVTLLGWKPFMHNPKLRRRLARITVPTLVLWGESDRVVSPDYGRAFHRAIPGSRFLLIPRAGHYPHRERPEDFVSAVTTFLLDGKA